MARPNETLKGMAAALAADLGLPGPDFGDLKNDGLELLVAELEKLKAERPGAVEKTPSAAAAPGARDAGPPNPPPIDGAADNNSGGAPSPEPAALPVPPAGSVSVAPGMSVVCQRGHLDAGTVVTASDLGVGKVGEENFADLLARGALIKS